MQRPRQARQPYPRILAVNESRRTKHKRQTQQKVARNTKRDGHRRKQQDATQSGQGLFSLQSR